jgi:hypothetical protein
MTSGAFCDVFGPGHNTGLAVCRHPDHHGLVSLPRLVTIPTNGWLLAHGWQTVFCFLQHHSDSGKSYATAYLPYRVSLRRGQKRGKLA